MGDMYEKLRAKIAMMKNEIYTSLGEGAGNVDRAGHPFGGAFNTPFKFIMTFYALGRGCSMQSWSGWRCE